MMDQAADIAFLAVMAAVSTLLLTMTACITTPAMTSDQNSANSTASVYPFVFFICRLTRTILFSKSPGYIVSITSMAACFTSRPGNSSYPNVVSSLISSKGGKTNGERKCQGS